MNAKIQPSGFRVGIYTRESRDDNEENYETIETQRDLLLDYVERNKLGEVFRVYIDDNVSGSGFEREGITQLREDVTGGKINLLVLKDLSRLGRNNAKTLLFLDFLEEYGVRVITFDGRYDSQKDNDTVGIETWVNERYIKDISRKIRANLRFKIEKGEYLGRAPYGYAKSPVEKNKLVVEPESAAVIKEIYKLYLGGYGYLHIANSLNSKEVPSPGNSDLGRGGWNAVAVKRILCNRVYVGDTVQGVSEKVSFKSKKTRRLPESSWVVTCGTHEPIISIDEFEQARKIRESRQTVESGSNKGELHIFKGMVFCGKCGGVMFARLRKSRPMGYICGSYCRKGREACTSHHISEAWLEKVLLNELEQLLEDTEIRKLAVDRLKKDMRKKNSRAQDISKLEQLLQARRNQQDILYMDRLEGKISEELFARMNTGLENRITQIKVEMEKFKSQSQWGFELEEAINKTIDRLKNQKLTYQIARLMIENVIVYGEGEFKEGDNYSAGQENYEADDGSPVLIRFKYDQIRQG